MADLEGLLKRLEAVSLKVSAAAGGGGGGEEGAGPALVGWQQFQKDKVGPFVDLLNKSKGLEKIAKWTKDAFDQVGLVIQAAQDCAKPSQPDLMKFIDPLAKIIQQAGNPDSRAATFPQEKAFAECIQSLSWIMVDGPKQHIMGQLEASDFYLSKVLTAAKDKAEPEKTQARDFVKLIKELLTEMGTYTADFFKMGLVWKPKGAALSSWKPGAAGAVKAAAPAGGKVTTESRLEAAIAALEAAAPRLGKARGGGGGDDGDVPARVTEWNALVAEHVAPFVAAANMIEGTKKIGKWAEDSFGFMSTLMAASAASKKPSQDELMKFLDPVVKIIQAAGNPDSRAATFPQEKAFAECVQCHSWVFQDGPKPFILGQLEAAEFYLNKVLTSNKDAGEPAKSASQAFVKTLKNLLTELATFCGNNFKMGLDWNPKGKPLAEFKAGGGGAAPSAAAGPPPPGPPPSAAALAKESGGAKPAGGGGLMGALGGIGAGLGGLKKAGDAAAKAPAGGGVKKAAAAAPAKLPPSTKVVQDKVYIENYGPEQKEPLVYKCEMIDGKPKTGVFIGKCKGCTIKIEGKAKNVTISGCEQAGIIFENCVTTVEVINSKRCQIQAIESAGTFMLDKCDRSKVYLPKSSCQAPNKALVYTTQCSSSTIFFDKSTGEEMEEYGAPEQILSTFEIGKPVHTIVVIPEVDKS